jgi:arsenate reductase (thioredoxin)
MSHKLNVLILCTGNSARSIMAEAILNALGGGRIAAFSAGSHPAGKVNPAALRQLQSVGLPTSGLHSKSWLEYSGSGAAAMDIVITVCDSAAAESCPVWRGSPVTAHWGMPDPAAVTGPEAAVRKAFDDAYQVLRYRLSLLSGLPLTELDHATLQARIRDIGMAIPGKAGKPA